MEKISVVIIDDNKQLRTSIQKYINKTDKMETIINAHDALKN